MSSKSRNFPAFEATSLMNKFKQLWLTETEAKLVFETRDGQAWGSLHVCLGEHPHQHPPHSQEYPRGQNSPARQRRRERREAARKVDSAAGKAATGSTEVAEEATKTVDEETVDNSVKEGKIAEEAFTDQIVAEDTEEVTIAKGQKGSLFVTDVDDEICTDEEYYDEIDTDVALTCFQCKIEHFPANYVEGDKVLKYGLCMWHL